jgi:8-oxo-dGTP pyrophosphatase MutT (NUDIX family)
LINIIDEIDRYQTDSEQEAVDKIAFLDFLRHHPDAYNRTNRLGHVTSSAIVVNQTMDQVLIVYHNIYRSWSWVGGHNDGNEDCLAVAIKETMEETGITHVTPWSEHIFMLDVIYVMNHHKHHSYVGDHLHFNLTYLLIADEHDPLHIRESENSGVSWFPLDSINDHVSEPRMKPIYQKAIDRIIRIRES